jgi:hypothetical protein
LHALQCGEYTSTSTSSPVLITRSSKLLRTISRHPAQRAQQHVQLDVAMTCEACTSRARVTLEEYSPTRMLRARVIRWSGC